MPKPAQITLIILGATGDLMTKKIAPALFHLHREGKLPADFRVIGFARRPFTDEAFRELVTSMLELRGELKADRSALASFLQRFSYVPGQLDERDGYTNLAARLNPRSHKLFYLAVAPHFFQPVLSHLAAIGLNRAQTGWSRLLVEKPFGVNQKTAEELDQRISELFTEDQIYRIDHYLAKEMMHNILAFRFHNNLFEPVWNKQHIERIEIQLLETIGVEKRGVFYDSLGALRDVGQNHHLQMLALITMDQPAKFEMSAIRAERAKLLETLMPLSTAEITRQTLRAQYVGYRDISGVAPNSQVETYFKLLAKLAHPRWQGVSILLEGGKRMDEDRTEICVTFKDKNKVLFTMEPFEGITIQFLSKKPGTVFELETRSFDFLLRQPSHVTQYVEEYERLLLDSILGDQTLFLSTHEVRAMWKFIDPIIAAWQSNAVPLLRYAPDTDETRKLTFGSK